MHSPRRSHFLAAHQILWYLKGTTGFGLTFKKTGKSDLIIYTNSDFAWSLIDGRSTTGYCAMLGGNLVTWRSKTRSVASKSSTEDEFRASLCGLAEVFCNKRLTQRFEDPI